MAPRRYVPVPAAHVGRKYTLRANVDPHTLERVRRFVEKVQAHYQPSIGADRIIAQLLNEALNARLFFTHPGSGRGKDDNLTGF